MGTYCKQKEHKSKTIEKEIYINETENFKASKGDTALVKCLVFH